MENKLYKIFFILPSEEDDNTYTSFSQVNGFKTEDDAKMYLIKNYKINIFDILNERTTLH